MRQENSTNLVIYITGCSKALHLLCLHSLVHLQFWRGAISEECMPIHYSTIFFVTKLLHSIQISLALTISAWRMIIRGTTH